ncbi:cytochrome c-type biogenesis protein [Glycocaulis abyssi]|uniref:Cytochrome c-type biogenesis protein n=1 Tax=Glycocaulis abyssi TaxID=1433403 RepID=A0ABV9N7M6_9PROT
MIAALLMALALQASPELAPADEARAQGLMREVRCMVCAGESVLDSSAPMAGDMRRFIREEIAAGREDEAVRTALVARFGHEVLMRPPMEVRTLPLWLAPVVFLALGGALLFTSMRRKAVKDSL